MRRFALAFATAVACATMGAAQDVVAPGGVAVDEYGGIATSLTGAPGDPANGQALMDKGSGNCIACHAVTELSHLGFHGTIGPVLDGAADRWTEADLRGIVVNAKNVFEGTMMPSFYRTTGFVRPGDAFTGNAPKGDVQPLLTAQEVEDVVAYLMTLKEG
ncbi:sulfur oxidation c-type cytochrome SoxX [Jannaschia rubra]|uniref:Cytochrome c n=1 Tax=Jannaschia rubra TaxID=282197 RepID=A0A0M6XL04_9RHOB|nr:sulfur oxidation c-type cytochrome SoxX [Jannaschia rubra]CTQ31352.1 Cytochrome c [Jannaschia rubra]SFF81159.1 monoheme cytochrome SoxX (sulfur oxidation) [Jannaschia rubra]